MPAHAFTIAKLANAAGVGVETVRYYQRRGLLDEAPQAGSFRSYNSEDVQRLQFIRRAQDLGFSLDDIAELLSLSTHPDKERVREITQLRLAEVRERMGQLHAMASALESLVDCCARSEDEACPIIAALAADTSPATNCCSTAMPGAAGRVQTGKSRKTAEATA